MINLSRNSFKDISAQFLKAYAWILFTNKPIIGAIFLIATFYQLNIGIAGFVAGVIATITVRLLKFNYAETGIHIFNAILVGLSLGAFYQLGISLLLIIIISAILTVFVTMMLMSFLTRFGTLPVLTAPFVLVAITLAFATKAFGNLSLNLGNIFYHITWLPESATDFFTALGSIFFLPHPQVGLILFLCILWQSRYLALLCVIGFVVGFYFYEYLSASEHERLAVYNGFNFSLTAMAIGGIYAIPSIASFCLAALGAAIAALVTAGTQSFMALHGLPVMALPFILTTLTFLSALSARNTSESPILRLDQPDLPEKHYERYRLATARLGDPNSVSLLPPFMGEWTVYQSFNGKHTHRPPWQHALDFIVTQEGKSYRNDGTNPEDYYCFGLPVRSPVYGVVSKTFDQLIDNIPGDVDVKNNWGNHIIIYLESGLYVLLAHLQRNSIKVKAGENIVPGQVLAACGNTGRSPQPHLHLQVQVNSLLGAKTYPFHLANVNIHKINESSEFHLAAIPQTGDHVITLENDAILASALHLTVGKILTYELTNDDNAELISRSFKVTLTLLGEFRLQSDYGASAAFIESSGLIAFYDRSGPDDPLLDAWLLALGITPFAGEINQWHDSPSADLFPTKPAEKIAYQIFSPLGKGLKSNYHREFDEENKSWTQTGLHQITILGRSIKATTQATISRKGIETIHINSSKQSLRAKLKSTTSSADIGIEGSTDDF